MLPSIVPAEVIEALVACAETAPPGAVAEIGVYQGGTAWRLMQVCRRQGRALHLFDTFAGIPDAEPIDRHGVGEFASDEAVVRRALPEAVFHTGVFPDTLPADLGERARRGDIGAGDQRLDDLGGHDRRQHDGTPGGTA